MGTITLNLSSIGDFYCLFQLCVSSTSTDELNRQAETAETTREKDAEPSRLTSNLTETAITTRENDEEQPSKLTSSLTETTTKVSDTEPLKWTPFPPPDVNAILSQMSLVRLTLEQLCAPISDDDEEEDGIKETQCGNSDVYIQQNSKEQSASTNDVTIPTHSSVKPPVTISRAASSDDIEVSASTHGTAECSTSIKTQAGRRNTKNGQPITNSSRNDSEAQPSNSKCTSTTVSLKESRHPPKPPAGKPCKPLKHQQVLHSDFIDLTDSSDEVNYQKPKKAGSSGHLSTSNPKRTAQNQASCDNEPSRRSEGKQPQSHPTEAEDEFDQLCMDIDLDTIDDFSDEEEVGPSHASDSLCNTSTTNTSSAVIYSGQKSNKMKTYDHGSRKGKSSIRDSQLSKHNPLPRKSSSDNARVASLQPPVVNTISAQYTTSAPSQSACPPPTACEKRGKRPNDFEVSLRAKQPRLEDLSHPPLRQVPSASISKGQSTSKNTRNVRVATAVDDDGVGSISSQELNTEHCPMCNTKFPAW